MTTGLDDARLAAAGARRINIDTEPGEMVLPRDAEQRLGWIADWLTGPPQLWSEWGLQHYLDGGLRALFRGPSGTGKTMAAIALAQGTGRALLQVDVGAVVSKYIGETENNLGELFAAAEKDKAILLFDEADALFGKRTEVSDAHDRYADLGIADLLRRIEPFAGLAILASNRGGELSADTVGRLDVLVDFPLPDEAARRQLWDKLLGTVKLAQGEIDTAKLAGEYALSGAEILRCVRIAALLATSASNPLDMELIEAAAEERVGMRAGKG